MSMTGGRADDFGRVDAGWIWSRSRGEALALLRDAWREVGLSDLGGQDEGPAAVEGFATLHTPPGLVLVAVWMRYENLEDGRRVLSLLDARAGAPRVSIVDAGCGRVSARVVREHVGSRFDIVHGKEESPED